jgi:sterol desaturase/sphingolipid hydroxylase (fatty acid hydroxylase superfamily)
MSGLGILYRDLIHTGTHVIDFLVEHEAAIRLSAFVTIFAVMAMWEIAFPARQLLVGKAHRWLSNIAVVVLNTVILRLIFPTAAVGFALYVEMNGIGLLHLTGWPLWWTVPLSVIFLDLVIYLQHVMVHAIPALWRIHRMHHADLDFDVTTGARFHPLEIVLSMLIKLAAIALIGPPVVAVVLFEIILNTTSMFNHANVSLPSTLDRWLRFIIVTPDMHRVHHSVEMDESNSNFGFNLPWWDRLFGTYRSQPRRSHQSMVIGLDSPRDEKICDRLPGMLMIPFSFKVTGYAINRRGTRVDRSGEDG